LTIASIAASSFLLPALWVHIVNVPPPADWLLLLDELPPLAHEAAVNDNAAANTTATVRASTVLGDLTSSSDELEVRGSVPLKKTARMREALPEAAAPRPKTS
jgi:hypothetical protein